MLEIRNTSGLYRIIFIYLFETFNIYNYILTFRNATLEHNFFYNLYKYKLGGGFKTFHFMVFI